MRWFWRFLKIFVVLGLLLAFQKLALPWIAEQAYLSRSRALPALAALHITSQNADQVQLLEKWQVGEILPGGYRLLDIVWQTSQQAELLAASGDILLLANFPPAERLHTWANPHIDGATWKASFSQDGRYLAAQYTNQVRVFAAQSGQPLSPWMDSMEIIALSPDGKRLAKAGTLGLSEDPSRVGVYKTDDGSQTALFKTSAYYWRDLVYSPDGALLVALGDGQRPPMAWMGSTPVFAWLNLQGYQLAFSGDGLVLATGNSIVFLKDRRVVPLQYPPPAQTPWGVAFSPGGDMLVTQTMEGGLYFWRVSDGALLTSRGIPPGQANITFSPDGVWFTVLIGDTIIRWGLP